MHPHHSHGRGRAGNHHHDSCGHRFHHGPFGRRKHGMGHGPHAEMFAAFAAHHGRARRGDVRTAVLRLLAEQPMHGYQIIQELAARSEGAWTPSAGSVYPTLQLLADEGLVSAENTGGKKVFSLTEAGSAAVAGFGDEPAPWESATPQAAGPAGAYREAATRLGQVMWQMGTTGSATQVEAATEILVEARKKLYALLAED